MYLLVFIYKYNKRRTQISQSTAPSRFFSGKILTKVRIGEFYHERLNTTIEDGLFLGLDLAYNRGESCT